MLPNVDLAAAARDTIYHIGLFTKCTHPCHIGYRHQWSLLLLLITAARVCCFLCGWGRSIADKVCRVAILLEDSSKVVNFLLKVVLRADDPPGPVMETSHHISLHMGWMMGLEVKVSVRVHVQEAH